MRRLAPFVVLAAIAAVVVVLLLPDPGHRYRLVFTNSSQVVDGGTVRIGGTQVGTVKSIGLTKNDLAEVEISVSGDFAPLRRGATATVRAQGTAGVASRYIDVSPGSGLEPALKDGATIPVDHTTPQVELDQLFSTFDKGTRTGLQKTIQGFSQWYTGREAEGNASGKALPKALSSLTDFAQDVNAQSAQFERLVTTSATAMSALASQSAQITSLVSGAGTTVNALGADTGALTSALDNAPAALRQGSAALAELRPALGDLRTLVNASDKPSKLLPSFLDELTPVATNSVPVFKQLRQVVSQPGPGNDVLDALKDLPALERSTRTGFPEGAKALKTSTPLLSFIRPYGPDLMAWFRSFGQSAATYDADGHYFSSEPVFDAFDLNGTTLTPKAPAERGRSTALSTGNLKRCPGAGMSTLPDKSNGFIDAGELANADCDPSETPGAK